MTSYAALLEGNWLIALIITIIAIAIIGLYLMLTTKEEKESMSKQEEKNQEPIVLNPHTGKSIQQQEPQITSEAINWKGNFVLGLRFLQVLALSLTAIGFIWGTGDYISSLLPADGPVAPLSVLLMLYGVVGSGIIEGAIRFVQRKK